MSQDKHASETIPVKECGPSRLDRTVDWLKLAWAEGREQGSDVSRTTHLLFFLCAGFCLLFFIWAAIFRLDIVSTAQGEVIPYSRVKRVQHLEGGIVREIMVREGDLVTEGQPLVALEEVLSETTVEELKTRVSSLRVDIARLEAEEMGLNVPNFSTELTESFPDLVQKALELFTSRHNRRLNEMATHEETIKQRQQDIIEIESRLATFRKNLPIVKRQVARNYELYQEKLVREDEYLARKKELNNLESEILESSAALERANSMFASANATMHQAENAWLEDIQTELSEARLELKEVEQRLRKYADIEQRTVIRSPVEGVVNTLYIVNEGEVVRPGMTIMDVVPAGDRLVIDARLPVSDIGYVRPGQAVVVKLPTADARRFGALQGEVVTISPDAMTLETGQTYYRVRVETSKDYFERGDERYKLFPGMQVMCAIHTGQRTLLQYLAYPYFDALSEGLREH